MPQDNMQNFRDRSDNESDGESAYSGESDYSSDGDNYNHESGSHDGSSHEPSNEWENRGPPSSQASGGTSTHQEGSEIFQPEECGGLVLTPSQIQESFREASGYYWGPLPPSPEEPEKLAKRYREYQNWIEETQTPPFAARRARDTPEAAVRRARYEIDEGFRHITQFWSSLMPPPVDERRFGPNLNQRYLAYLAAHLAYQASPTQGSESGIFSSDQESESGESQEDVSSRRSGESQEDAPSRREETVANQPQQQDQPAPPKGWRLWKCEIITLLVFLAAACSCYFGKDRICHWYRNEFKHPGPSKFLAQSPSPLPNANTNQMTANVNAVPNINLLPLGNQNGGVIISQSPNQVQEPMQAQDLNIKTTAAITGPNQNASFVPFPTQWLPGAAGGNLGGAATQNHTGAQSPMPGVGNVEQEHHDYFQFIEHNNIIAERIALWKNLYLRRDAKITVRDEGTLDITDKIQISDKSTFTVEQGGKVNTDLLLLSHQAQFSVDGILSAKSKELNPAEKNSSLEFRESRFTNTGAEASSLLIRSAELTAYGTLKIQNLIQIQGSSTLTVKEGGKVETDSLWLFNQAKVIVDGKLTFKSLKVDDDPVVKISGNFCGSGLVIFNGAEIQMSECTEVQQV